jgi:hypothetical protein
LALRGWRAKSLADGQPLPSGELMLAVHAPRPSNASAKAPPQRLVKA